MRNARKRETMVRGFLRKTARLRRLLAALFFGEEQFSPSVFTSHGRRIPRRGKLHRFDANYGDYCDLGKISPSPIAPRRPFPRRFPWTICASISDQWKGSPLWIAVTVVREPQVGRQKRCTDYNENCVHYHVYRARHVCVGTRSFSLGAAERPGCRKRRVSSPFAALNHRIPL